MHILRCSTNEINLFISVRSNKKGNDRIISTAVARGGARGAIAPKDSRQVFKSPKFKSKATC